MAEIQDNSGEKAKVCRISPLNICREPEIDPCHCYSCTYISVSSLQLAYFVYFGLKFDIYVKVEEIFWFKITPEVVAQAYNIWEQRVEALERQKFPTLESLCYMVLTSKRPALESNALLPITVRESLESLGASFDLMDKVFSETPGNSIYHPCKFPKFLFKHVGKFIGGGFDVKEMGVSKKEDDVLSNAEDAQTSPAVELIYSRV